MEALVPFFGVFTSLIMVYYFIRVKKRNLFLLLYFLCSNILLLTYFVLYFSKNTFLEALCFVHFIPLTYLLGPLLFFYMKYSLRPIRFQKRDFIHLLPAFFCFIYTIPFYLLPFKEKIILAHEIVNISFNFHLKISFFSLELILYCRSIHLLIYAIFSLIYMKLKFYRFIKVHGPLSKELKSYTLFITLLLSLQILIAVYNHGFTSVVQSKFYILFWGIPLHLIFTKLYYFRVMGIGFFLQNFFLFFFPSILTNKKFVLRIFLDKKIKNETNSYIPNDLNFQNKTQILTKKLADYLVESAIIDHHFSLKKMSFELNIPEREISNYLKNNLNTTFCDWKNSLRLDYATNLIDQGNANYMTIQGISQSVGIQSRSKFIDLFKKNKGMTPSEYIKNRIHTK